MQNSYLVPANSKKQSLIFGFLKPLDLIIFAVGTGLSFILLITLSVTELWAVIVTLLPVVISGFLVFPLPNYHNTRVLIYDLYKYLFVNRRKYIWRGWCYEYEQSDEQSNK